MSILIRPIRKRNMVPYYSECIDSASNVLLRDDVKTSHDEVNPSAWLVSEEPYTVIPDTNILMTNTHLMLIGNATRCIFFYQASILFHSFHLCQQVIFNVPIQMHRLHE